MAYNNGFPVSYQPQPLRDYYPQQYQVPVQQPMAPQNQPRSNPMIWVQGETGAKSYLMEPNMTLPLWDSEAQVIYLKSTDASGMPTMKILDYMIRDGATNTKPLPTIEPQNVDYVTHDELKELEERILSKLDNSKGRRQGNEQRFSNNANARSDKK